MDTYGLRSACETAAAAATVLADRVRAIIHASAPLGIYASSPPQQLFSYRGSLGRSNSYSSINDAYSYDDPYRRAAGHLQPPCRTCPSSSGSDYLFVYSSSHF